MSLKARVFLVWLFVCLSCNFFFTDIVVAAERCENPAGRLVSVQGDVSVQTAGASTWIDAGLDHLLCPGDTLRVGEKGRAAVVLANESVLRVGQNSALSFAESTTEKVSLLKLLQGILHIFSHRPHSLNIATPFVSGAVEGTEFLVRVMPDQAIITVFEGRVMAANGQGELAVSSGQSIVAEAGQAPRYETVVRPRDAVQWTLYYPPIIDRDRGEAGRSDLSPLSAAVDALAVGRVDEARRLITEVLDKDAGNGDALALLAIIELTRNNTEEAGRLAAQATDADPTSVAAALAASYVRQAAFDIPGALATLERARQSNPDSAELLARLAELQLSAGELDTAEASAMQAAALNPDIGRIQAVLGFAHLTRIETEKAKEAFARAIVLDPAMPLARLGLGLALIREGDLEKGRAEIEIAAALDPGNALIRSYLGKAYYEEKRDGGAARQYEIARELDPVDPTPWFYDALRKQSINRPVEALHDLQKSIELNDNRAVYRSRLLLDEDLAVRNVGLASIYSDLGFEKLALVDGVKSVGIDSSNYSAHRFLSDIYSSQPRHEIARVSEMLQSQILQPVNGNPVHPQSGQSNLKIFRDTELNNASFNEYTTLFQRDKVSLTAAGLVGGNDTWGDEFVVSGMKGRFSGSIGGMQYNTDGFRENNDQEQDIHNAFSKVALFTQTNLMAEYRNVDRRFGDLPLRYDEDIFYPSDRNSDESESIRLGFHHAFSPRSDLIGTAILADHDSFLELEPEQWLYETWLRGGKIEMQQIVRSDIFNTLFGVAYLDTKDTDTMKAAFLTDIVADNYQKNLRAYSYFNISVIDPLIWTVGANIESTDGKQNADSFNPKIGIIWTPWNSTTFRTAVTKTHRWNLIDDQTLEPTHVAGFNQFYDDTLGTEAWRYGLAVDHKFNDKTFAGVEYSVRDLNVPYSDSNNVEQTTEWQEQQSRIYMCWVPLNWLSTSLEYVWDRHERNMQYSGPEQVSLLNTHSLPLTITGHFANGFSSITKMTYVNQDGVYDPYPTSYVSVNGDDSFIIVDMAVRYRLSKRLGFFSLEIKNLFDEQFNFQTMDPARPEYVPEQTILGKLTISL